MLMLSRKVGERLLIGPNVVLEVDKIHANHVMLGVKAPPGVTILREEVADRYPQVLSTGDAILRPIETAPKDGRYIILFGPSGYTSTPLRCAMCRWDADYRPLAPWQTYDNEPFESSGGPPTHWMEMPQLEEQVADRNTTDKRC